MGQWRIFSGCLLSEIFGWRQNSEVFFSCCVLSTWGWELGDGTVWKFFLSFYFTSKLLPLPPKKFITWFQFTTILTGALVHWQSFVKQNLSNDFSSLTLAIAHCTQSPLPVAVHRCQKYLFMEMVKWCYDFVVVFCQKMLSHDLPITVACRHCQSPLPFAFASQCWQSMLPVAIRCFCSFLWVLFFSIWWSKHFDRSVGREAWGRKHGTDNEAFFSGCLLSKEFFMELGQWGIFF